MGKNEFLQKEILIWLFLTHKLLDFWVPVPPPSQRELCGAPQFPINPQSNPRPHAQVPPRIFAQTALQSSAAFGQPHYSSVPHRTQSPSVCRSRAWPSVPAAFPPPDAAPQDVKVGVGCPARSYLWRDDGGDGAGDGGQGCAECVAYGTGGGGGMRA